MSYAAYSGLLLIAVLAALVAILRYQDRTRRRRWVERLKLVCPRGKGPVECALVWDPPQRLFLGVESCTGFARPREVTCPLTCVTLLNEPFGRDAGEGGDA